MTKTTAVARAKIVRIATDGAARYALLEQTQLEHIGILRNRVVAEG